MGENVFLVFLAVIQCVVEVWDTSDEKLTNNKKNGSYMLALVSNCGIPLSL